MARLTGVLGRKGSSPIQQPDAWHPDILRISAPQKTHVRPTTGTRLAPGATLHHDGGDAELTISQDRAQTGFQLVVECYAFAGRYLSIALDLDPSLSQGLSKQHILHADVSLSSEAPMPVFARLNIRAGVNVVQVAEEVPASGKIAYDMAYAKLVPAPVEKVWMDLIFDAPQMNRVVLKDLTVHRTTRAPL